MLYFYDLNQIVRVPIPEGHIKEIKNLSDDRVFLMRVPERLEATGFLLSVFVGQSILLFHINNHQN